MLNKARLLISAGMLCVAGLAGCAAPTPGTVAPPAAQRLLGAVVASDPGSGSVIAFGGQGRRGRQIGPSSLT